MPIASVIARVGEQRNAAGKLQKFFYKVGRNNTELLSAIQTGALSGFIAGTLVAIPTLAILAPIAGIPTGVVGASVGAVVGVIKEQLANNKLDTMEEQIRTLDLPALHALEAEMASGTYQVRATKEDGELVVYWEAA